MAQQTINLGTYSFGSAVSLPESHRINPSLVVRWPFFLSGYARSFFNRPPGPS